MKIALIRPYYYIPKFYVPFFMNESLGLEYLASNLKGHHEVYLYDAVAEEVNYYEPTEKEGLLRMGANLEKIRKFIQDFQPEVVGLTCTFFSQERCNQEVARMIKQEAPNTSIIIGGNHASTHPERLLNENPEFDIAVINEGEWTIKKLLDQKLQNLDSVDGICYRVDGGVKKTKPVTLERNLDIFPFPERESFPYANLFQQDVHLSLIDKVQKFVPDVYYSKPVRDFSRSRLLNKLHKRLFNKKNQSRIHRPSADILTSRGCPNLCRFCAVKNIWTRNYRMRSAEDVLAEIDYLVNTYGIRHLNIQDDNFNISKKRVIKICKGLVDRQYDLTITANSGTYIPTLNEEVLYWLKKAGMHRLKMSIESGDQEKLDTVINKAIKLPNVKPICDAARKVGMASEGCFIIGMPGETKESMQRTVEFAHSQGFSRVQLFIYQPFPFTEAYDECVEKGYLTDDYDPTNLFVTGDKSFVRTEDFEPEDVVRIARGENVVMPQGDDILTMEPSVVKNRELDPLFADKGNI